MLLSSYNFNFEITIISKLYDHRYIRNKYRILLSESVAYPGIFFRGEGGSTNSVEDREDGDLGMVAP